MVSHTEGRTRSTERREERRCIDGSSNVQLGSLNRSRSKGMPALDKLGGSRDVDPILFTPSVERRCNRGNLPMLFASHVLDPRNNGDMILDLGLVVCCRKPKKPTFIAIQPKVLLPPNARLLGCLILGKRTENLVCPKIDVGILGNHDIIGSLVSWE